MTAGNIKPIDWNWKPKSPVCFVDFETQSTLDLRDVGVWAYVSHPSTRIMSAVFKVPGRRPLTWVPRPIPGLKFPNLVTGEAVPAEVKALASDRVWVAHNAEGFDALLWSTLYPSIRPQWRDTHPLARCLGLPGGLDALAKRLGSKGKTKTGSRAMMLLTRATFKNGRTTYPRGTLPIWTTLLKYNVTDVTELEKVYRTLSTALKHHQHHLDIHSRINDRGVHIDARLAKTLLKSWDRVKSDAVRSIAELTDGELTDRNIRSGPTVHAWLKHQGLTVDNLRREELEAILDDPDRLGDVDDLGLVREVLTSRSLILRPAENKLQRLLDSGGDVLRYLHTYHAAATGRWSSRGVQIHNLPAPQDIDVGVALKSVDTIADMEDPAPTLNALVRPIFVARPGESLGIIDFASIEARGVAWVANQEDLLELFRNGQDVYCDMASGLFGREITPDDKLERKVGKQIVLGCGYSMGAARFGALCNQNRIDLASVNLDAKTCVTAYRKRYAAIPAIWSAYDKAAMSTVRTGKTNAAGRVYFEKHGDALVIVLPSGRPIYYREAAIVRQVPAWAKLTGRTDVPPQDAVIYQHPHGYGKTLYGGLITENIVQAICRDLMADALVRLEDAGFEVRLHVHDEAVIGNVRNRGDLVRACQLMATAPDWADGFPIACEGFTGKRYTKTPLKGAYHANA